MENTNEPIEEEEGSQLKDLIGADILSIGKTVVPTEEEPIIEPVVEPKTKALALSHVKGYPILTYRSVPIEYSDEQREVLCKVQDFLDIKGYAAFLINGNSGSGKTTISENVVKYSGATVLAPTNAALQRLRDKINISDPNRFKTIHGLLYGEPDDDGNFKLSGNAQVASVYIVDESSMIDVKLLNDLTNHAKRYQSKLIFLGDDFQLEPVGEDPKLFLNKGNAYFDKGHTFKINTVKRSIGDILKVATHIRTRNRPEILNIFSDEFRVVTNMQDYINQAVDEKFDYAIVVATNKTRMNVNRYVRNRMYTQDVASTNPIMDGEKVISVANNNFVNSEVYKIREPRIVESFEDLDVNIGSRKFPNERKYNFYLVEHKVEGEGDRLYKTLLIPNLDLPSLHGAQLLNTPEFQNDTYRTFNQLSFRPIWLKSVNIATYGYAISCNKAQGNEWANVYVYVDWLFDGNVRNKWLYTAITRGKNRVVINQNKYITLVEPPKDV